MDMIKMGLYMLLGPLLHFGGIEFMEKPLMFLSIMFCVLGIDLIDTHNRK